MLAILLSLTAMVASQADGDQRPNFILINCDDLGYGDVGCYGSSKHRTPNIDTMASEGLRLTSFYVTSGVCTPSRSSLMTGCYPRRVSMHVNEEGRVVLFPGNKKGLHPDEVTIAEVLKARGYATAIVGKWHLGDQPEFLPTRQGFDSYFGIPFSNDMDQKSRPQNNYPPLPLLENESVIETEPDQRLLTRRYTERAVQFITQNKGRPFFLYLPHTFPHWPHFASEQFEGKSANGIYGDCIEELDWSTGEILKTLKSLGIDDRTLVLFTSDNGGVLRNGASNGPLKGGKASTFEGGQRVPCIIRWPGHVPSGKTSDELLTSMDVMPTFAHLAGAKVPEDRIIDGHNVWDVLTGKPRARSPHKAFYYFHLTDLECVRSGRWKLRIRYPNRNGQPRMVTELYDLATDIGETTDVAARNPKIVQQLYRLIESGRRDLGDGEAKGANQRPAGMVEHAKPLTQS